ncbi:MAG: lipid-A-disaccharide synthase [Pseudomonadota bacterium]|nr:lipid-A-disaccharide synthase [Pseudomonadota bacterium]
MVKKANPPFVWFIAGEPSGDLLGAKLISALKQETGGSLRINGIGGECMEAEGFVSLFPISDISVMGLVEILPRIPLIKRRLRQTIRSIQADKPDVVVTIDAPGFCYDVWKGLRGTGIKLVHYVAPSVWAWRPGRAKKFAAELDHLMTLLPFEPPFFRKYGLSSTFVGHPVIEGEANKGDGTVFRERNKIQPEALIVCVLSGSRTSEVKRLGKVFRSVSRILLEDYPQTIFVFPTVSYLRAHVDVLAASWPGRAIVTDTLKEKFDAMAASNVALAASGTVSLELAIAEVPHIIAYRLNGLTVAIFRILHGLNQRYANLLNILLEREVIPEFIQARCRPDQIANSLLELVREPALRDRQLAGASQALQMLQSDGGCPSSTAASVIMSLLDDKKDRET